jgi:hypothetical protein
VHKETMKKSMKKKYSDSSRIGEERRREESMIVG